MHAVAAGPRYSLTVRSPQLGMLLPGTEPAAVTAAADGGPDGAPETPLPSRYRRIHAPCVLIYRVESGAHSQTGIVLEVAVDDYRAGRIRKHEATEPERVRLLGEALATGGVEQIPVALAHRDNHTLRELLAESTGGEPELVMTARDGVRHTVWTQRDPEMIRAIEAQLHQLDALYIADGHHRMAAADRNGLPLSPQEPEASAAPAFTLAAVFPAEELRILGYHRCVRMPEGVGPAELLDALAAAPAVADVQRLGESTTPATEPGTVLVWLAGRWYRLRLHRRAEASPRAGLDVVALDEGVLKPVFGIEHVPTHAAVTPLPGDIAPEELAERCAAQSSIGFLPHPPSVQTVLQLADAGEVMPPKSTWFEPKLRLALFLRQRSRAVAACAER